MAENEYMPIAEYGLIGNMETSALVGTDGSIDWCCLPHLNSSSVFAALLDSEQGGRFVISPSCPFDAEQEYIERTNVLRTTFRTDSGTATVTDFFPLIEGGEGNQPKVRGLYRKVSCTNGTIDLDLAFEPRFDYARAETKTERIADGVLASGEARRMTLASPVDIGDDEVHTSYTLSEEDTSWFVLEYGTRAPTDPEDCERLLEETIQFWRGWAHSCDREECPFDGYDHDLAVRSDLLLKLLVYGGTGGITAAPTTSLPEEIGGVRNWDYRYNWIRDGAFTVRAFGNLGSTDLAEEYLNQFLDLSRSIDPADIQPLYSLQHDATYEETDLSHLSGYRDSAPVRIGNGAANQLQLGMYGELVLAIDQLDDVDRELWREDWSAVQAIIEYVREMWDEPDAGIWEIRSGPKHFVHSKAMCCVALDRAISMAEDKGFECPLEEWRADRETIKATVIERGFDESIGEQGSFTQAFDDDQLDASLLLLPLSEFLPFDDPRIEGTVAAIRDRLATEEGFVYRYEHDDLPGGEGAFVLCFLIPYSPNGFLTWSSIVGTSTLGPCTQMVPQCIICWT